MVKQAIAASLFIVCFTGPCNAADPANEANMPWPSMFVVHDWGFQPIVHKGCAATTVESVLAFRLPGTVSGDNIVAVWYIKDGSVPGGWTAKTWETEDLKEVVASIKSTAAISDAFDGYWSACNPATFTGIPETVKPYKDGFVDGDPLGIVVNSCTARDA